MGAGTRTIMQRDRIGAMRLLVALQQMMIRSVAVYFSIVRRSPAWASRDRLPPSWMTTTAWALHRHNC